MLLVLLMLFVSGFLIRLSRLKQPLCQLYKQADLQGENGDFAWF